MPAQDFEALRNAARELAESLADVSEGMAAEGLALRGAWSGGTMADAERLHIRALARRNDAWRALSALLKP